MFCILLKVHCPISILFMALLCAVLCILQSWKSFTAFHIDVRTLFYFAHFSRRRCCYNGPRKEKHKTKQEITKFYSILYIMRQCSCAALYKCTPDSFHSNVMKKEKPKNHQHYYCYPAVLLPVKQFLSITGTRWPTVYSARRFRRWLWVLLMFLVVL